MNKAKIGIIGCGNISEKYIHNLTNLFENTEVVAVSDIVEENAVFRAKQFSIPRVCKTNDELLGIPEIDIVAILTNPAQHAAVGKTCLSAGKHVYIEKPLSLSVDDGKELVETAAQRKLMLGGAPDTILGAGIQTCRKLIDDGWIGEPIAAISHILTGGPESWHPSPAFLYHKGAGPLYDVAPYYVAGLSYLLGCAQSVMCSAKITYPERTITSKPLYGTKIQVEVPTYLAGILNMENGIIASIHHSFDVNGTKLTNQIEIYGTEGALITPTPCDFSGEILFKGRKDAQWSTIPLLFPYREDSRGIGVADMAAALIERKPHRLNEDFVFHTLNVLEELSLSAQNNEARKVTSRFKRTASMEMSAVFGDEQPK